MKRIEWDYAGVAVDMSNPGTTPQEEWFRLVPGREIGVAKDGASIRLRVIEAQNGTCKAVVVQLDDGETLPAGLEIGDEVTVGSRSVTAYW